MGRAAALPLKPPPWRGRWLAVRPDGRGGYRKAAAAFGRCFIPGSLVRRRQVLTKAGACPFCPVCALGTSPGRHRGRHGCGAHPASGSGKRRTGYSSLHQTYAMLATLQKTILSEHGSIFVCTPALFFSYTVHGAPLLLRTEKKRRGVHLGQDCKSMPCWRKR